MIRRSVLALAFAAVAAPALAQFDTMTQKPIVKAVREGDEEKVRQALLKGENPNQVDSSGRPLLMIAVMDGQVAVVDALLKGGSVVDGVDREGYTSLIRAAERGDYDIADMLLKRQRQAERADPPGRDAADGGRAARPCRDRAPAARQEGRSQRPRLHRPHRAQLRQAEQPGQHRGPSAQGRRP